MAVQKSWALLLGALAFASGPARSEPSLVPVSGDPGVLLGPAPVPKTLADGRFTAKHTALDTGKPASVFDGDAGTVIRTPSLNPAFFEFTAAEPISFHGIRVHTTGDRHEFTLAAAATDDDLQRKAGTWRVLAEGTTDGSGDVIYAGREAVSFAAFRLDLRRIDGDDYVHISEWEFLAPVRLTSLDVSYKVRTSHADEKAVFLPLDGNATRPEDSLLIPRVLATRDDGKVFDATSVADIRFRSKHARAWRGNRMLELTRPETVGVSVSLGGLKKTGTVSVTPRAVKNREMDLDVLYIERLPRLDFDGPNGGWPEIGQKVVWRAHVQNWGTRDVTVACRWLLDGKPTAKGEVAIRAGQTASVDLPRYWESTRRSLAFTLDPDDRVPERVRGNNRVEIDTHALAVGFYVDRSYADFFHEHQHELGLDDANSFADWGQRIIRHWNKMSERSVYPEFPKGVIDRVRLDRVLVVPDQAVPFQGGDWPTNFPNLEDKSVDLLWGFPYKPDQMEKPMDLDAARKAAAEGNPSGHYFYHDMGLIHELFHARGVIDSYGFDVHADNGDKEPKDSHIRIQDGQGRYILGLYLQPHGMAHGNKYPGIMGGGEGQFGPYEVMAWNRIAGQRARKGNCNGTSLIGDYLQDIPGSFRIRFVGPNGDKLADAPVKVYWAGPTDSWYGKDYDNTPDREYRTDADGAITTDATFFSKDGKIVHTWGHANSVPIVRIDHDGRTYFVFVEASEVNMLANLAKDPLPAMNVVVPLRTGDPEPLPVDYGRVRLPDWRWRTPMERPAGQAFH